MINLTVVSHYFTLSIFASYKHFVFLFKTIWEANDKMVTYSKSYDPLIFDKSSVRVQKSGGIKFVRVWKILGIMHDIADVHHKQRILKIEMVFIIKLRIIL